MHNPRLSYPHNLTERKVHEQIQKGVPRFVALPIPYRLDPEISISGIKGEYGP